MTPDLESLFTRGTANVIPNPAALQTALTSGHKLNVYLGIDPTSTRIHLGHAVALRKLQLLAQLGHHVTFLIGDFTALIGDTSDKDTERPVLTSAQIEANFQTYKTQAEKILDFSQVLVRRNSEWLGKLDYAEIIKLCRHFTLNDFISRELIKTRLNAGRSVSLPEVLYPVMQGYDSYFMDTDLQLGGTDQTFNMQAGRTLQSKLRGKESFVLSVEFLPGTDGRKMSKTWNNAIWLNDSPDEMYGKVMSLKDELILPYFSLATNAPQSRLDEVSSLLSSGRNPMQIKHQLAALIVTELHSPDAAASAAAAFTATIQEGQIPADIPAYTLSSSSDIVTILAASGLAPSKSEARRLIDQGAVEFAGAKVASPDALISAPGVLRAGKRRYLKIEIS